MTQSQSASPSTGHPGPTRQRVGLVLAIISVVVVLIAGGMSFGRELRAIGSTLLILCSSTGLGLWFLGRKRQLKAEDLLFAAGLGLGCYGLLMFLLSALQLWNDLTVWITFLLSLIAASPNFTQIYRTLKLSWEEGKRAEPWKPLHVLLLVGGGCLSAFLFAYAMLPPMGFDGLEYHLGAPWAWWQGGGMHFLPRLFYSNFPMNVEMLLTLGWRLGGESGIQVLHACLGLLCAAGIFLWLRRGLSRTLSLLGALVFLTDFEIIKLAVSAKIDLGLTLYSLLAFMAWWDWWKSGEQRGAILCGIFCGLAAGAKYSAIGLVCFPLGIGLVVGLAIRKAPLKQWLMVLWFTVAIAVLFAPWAIKNTIYEGNPVFPLAYSVFGGESMDDEIAQFLKVTTDATWPEEIKNLDPEKPARGVWFILTQGQPLLTLFLLLAIPMLLTVRKGRFRMLVGLLLLSWAVWIFLSRPLPRYLVPLYPALVFTMLWAWQKTDQALLKKMTIILLAILAIANLRSIGTRHSLMARYLFKQASREEVLFSSLPHFQAIEYVNRQLNPETDRVLMVAEARGYGCKVSYDLNTVYDHSILLEIIGNESNPARWPAMLRDAGYTYLLFNEIELARYRTTFESEGWKEGKPTEQAMRLLQRMPDLELLFATRQTKSGRVYVYKINPR